MAFSNDWRKHLERELNTVREAGQEKRERLIDSPQAGRIRLESGAEVLNFCANNYLGLADHPALLEAAHRALDRWGYGMASVRFICGTQTPHHLLEKRLSRFLGTEDTILYGSCFDANAGLFEVILGEEDAVFSDELNHASIIDGIRLCKARRFRYRNRDRADLEEKLKEASGARLRLIVTDGVFSMDGYIADLPGICDLAERYDALVVVDDSHAVGVLGADGRGTPEHHGVADRVDLVTGTLGKALGGASGGYVSGKKLFIDLLRQRSRPYLFSNTLAPVIAAVSLAAIDLVENSSDLRDRLHENARWFREAMVENGFDVLPGEHPIVPVMIGEAALASRVAGAMLDEGIYVTAFSYPVVPRGRARIRVQVSAAHRREDLERAVAAFVLAREETGLGGKAP